MKEFLEKFLNSLESMNRKVGKVIISLVKGV